MEEENRAVKEMEVSETEVYALDDPQQFGSSQILEVQVSSGLAWHHLTHS